MIKEFFKKNNIWFGMVLALIVPLINYVILSFLADFISKQFYFSAVRAISEMNIQLTAVFLNIFIFKRYMFKPEYEMTGRGVLVLTFLMVLIHFFIRWGIMN